MLLYHQSAPVVCRRQKIVRENNWGGEGWRGAFYFCNVCIFPSSHLYFGRSLSRNDLRQEIRNVCGAAP